MFIIIFIILTDLEESKERLNEKETEPSVLPKICKSPGPSKRRSKRQTSSSHDFVEIDLTNIPSQRNLQPQPSTSRGSRDVVSFKIIIFLTFITRFSP